MQYKNRLTYVLVARANHRCCAFFAIPSSSDCSEADTDPQGYSAPTPIPRKNLVTRESVLWNKIKATAGNIYRITTSIVNNPCTLPLAPSDAAESAEKNATMPVAVIYTTVACQQHQLCVQKVLFLPSRTCDHIYQISNRSLASQEQCQRNRCWLRSYCNFLGTPFYHIFASTLPG